MELILTADAHKGDTLWHCIAIRETQINENLFFAIFSL